MIKTLHVDGYRGFSRFKMSGLGQINLLVGKNNSGKTTVLEAIHVLCAGSPMGSLWQHCSKRGERLQPTDLDGPTGPGSRVRPDLELDISHIFSGHQLSVGSEFTIRATNQGTDKSVQVRVDLSSEKERDQQQDLIASPETLAAPRLILMVRARPKSPLRAIPLSRRGGLLYENIDAFSRTVRRSDESEPQAHFISPESMNAGQLNYLWDKIALTPHEELVLQALRFLDPEIERIAATGTSRVVGRGGFIIRRKGYSHPIPIGSMGDGMWRMLAMAIAITQSRHGVLLIDEIDTGLHYSVMAEMWKLIFGVAKQFHVQVFATTHSYDCVHSLATVCRSSPSDTSAVTIQRIEDGQAVPYSEAEIKVAAQKRIEMR